MLRALQNIIVAAVGLLFCWFPVLVATYDAFRLDRGTFAQCQAREWGRWWAIYLDMRA